MARACVRVLGWAMRRSKPIYVLIKSGWDSTEIVRAYAKKDDAQLHCDSANASNKSTMTRYSVERVNFIYEV